MLYPEFAELIKLQAASFANVRTIKHRQAMLTPGDYTSLFRGQGMEFDAVRPYIVGDDIRHIDWRVTARTKKPHVKTFQAECDRKVVLAVDVNSYMQFGTRGTFKSIQAARAAAVLAGVGFKNRDRVGGLAFGNIADCIQYFPPIRQRTAVWRLFKLLCKPVANTAAVSLDLALKQLLQNLATGTLVFLITDLDAILAADVRLIAEIQSRGDLVLLPVIDPIEYDFPALDCFTCQGEGGDKVDINMLSPVTRDKYALLWQQQQGKLKSLVQKYRIKLINLTTDGLVQRELNAG